MSKWAPDNEHGQHAYLVTSRSVWDSARGLPGYVHLEYAGSLAEAKRNYGYTRELHTTVYVRRATVGDVEAAS